jgi:L,D-peptidoglycan transpeptidase YkuD (ErfK/YbiS/YcfS/YnhG family)
MTSVWSAAAVVPLAAVLAVTACSAPPPTTAPERTTPQPAAPLLAQAEPAATPAATRPTPTSTTPPPKATPTPTPTPKPTPKPKPKGTPCSVPGGVKAAQVVLVKGTGTRATVTACSRTSAGRYVRALGPYAGRVGRSGVAAPGAKREGDGHTPAGVFPLRGGFGTSADPGTALPWMRVDADDVWVDDPGSARYNTHQVLPVAGRWASAESLDIPAYAYAQVIGYNEARTAGRGSAIFLHLDTGGPTAGCVSLQRSDLLRLLRWQRPGGVIAIS